MIVVKPSAELISITPNAAQLIEAAGRTCYKSEDKITAESAGPFIQKLKDMGHLSVLEHAVASFRVICDRGVSHEAVRHRIASYSQESTRYCNYSKEKFGNQISVIAPPGIARCDDGVVTLGACGCKCCASFEAWVAAVRTAENSYARLIENGVAPQIARSVLPTCLKTEFVWTANFREWLEVLRQRGQKPAHPQMVEIVGGFIRPALQKACPEVFA